MVLPSIGDLFIKNKFAVIISILVSASALLLAILHLVFPAWAIDGRFIVLLIVAVVPWLGTMFESLEFPGGWKVKYRDLQATEQKAKEAGLISSSPVEDAPSYLIVADQDPNLALAGLRIEIEKRLRKTAKEKGIDASRLGLNQLLRKLSEVQAISLNARSVLSDMTTLLNNAAHGANVEPRAAEWAINVGPKILAALDEQS